MESIRTRTQNLIARVRLFLADYSVAMVGTHASSMAYYFFTSIIPLAIILVFVVSHVGFSKEELVGLIGDTIPEMLGGFVRGIIDEAYNNAELTLSFSAITLIWTASKGAMALIRGLNAVYVVKENRNFLELVVMSVTAVVVFILLLVAAMYLIFEDGVVRVVSILVPQFVGPDLTTIVVHFSLLFGISVFAFTLCFTFLPAERRGFALQIPGALLSAAAWLLFSIGFRVYVDFSTKYTLIYGSLATIVVLLFWLYCTFLILLVGGLFNTHRKIWLGRIKQPEPSLQERLIPK